MYSVFRMPIPSLITPSSGGPQRKATYPIVAAALTRAAALAGSSAAADIPIGKASATPAPQSAAPTNISGTFGAWIGGKLDDRLGPKKVIAGSLVILLVALITILFVFPLYKAGLPWESDFTWDLTNYTELWFAGIGIVFGGWWFLSAKNWFKGPVRQGTEEELERREAELAGPSPAA